MELARFAGRLADTRISGVGRTFVVNVYLCLFSLYSLFLRANGGIWPVFPNLQD